MEKKSVPFKLIGPTFRLKTSSKRSDIPNVQVKLCICFDHTYFILELGSKKSMFTTKILNGFFVQCIYIYVLTVFDYGYL